jgi:hypothetical protein
MHGWKTIMSRMLFEALMILPILLAIQDCKGVNEPASEGAKIIVLVQWENSPVEGKKVEVIETGQVSTTDNNGVAAMSVLPGSYTVRVYEINQGGPCCAYLDLDVTVTADETITLGVVDCLPCV